MAADLMANDLENVIVDVQNLSFSYPDGAKALKKIDFKVPKGQLVAILGANGAGKTTLCHHLTGIIPNIYQGATEGKVRVAGMDVYKHPVYELAQKVGFVTQDPEGQLINPDVLMEVAFGPENLGVPRDEIMRRTKWALEAVGLEGLESRSPSELSGGQKQRLVLAAGLSMQPEVLVLDEPTSQLDPIGTSEVLDSLVDLKNKYGMTTLFTTHATEDVLRAADRAIVFSKGEKVADGTPREVFSQVELLESVGVQIPQLALLGHKIAPDKQVPFTIDDSKELVSQLIQNRHLTPTHKPPAPQGVESGEVVLECEDLTFTYPGFPPVTALRNVNLKIHRGEMVGIIGQNGSGKTTLVKQFLRLLKPTKGRILFQSKDIQGFTTGELATSIGLVLQNPDEQLFTISCKNEVEFGLRNLKLPEDEIKRRVDEALGFVGLQEQWDTFPFRLSFGDRRSLTVAAVVAMRPEIIVLDEPTTAQDYLGRHRIARLGKKLNEAGHTVIMITHDMHLVTQYADRTIVMANGEILLDGATSAVFSETETLRKAFIKPPPIALLDKELESLGVPQGILTVDAMVDCLKGGS
jgi:energy-coupling factor transporter ATP-binding protein EcfA2